MDITETTLISKSSEQTSGQLDGEAVLMHMENGSYFGLGNTGSKIWELLDKPMQAGMLCNELTKVYEVDMKTCFEDVRSFLVKLKEAKLITCT